MDPDISSDARILRGAVALYISADQRSKGVRRLPAGYPDRPTHRQMLDSCIAECIAVEDLVKGARLTFGYSRNGKTKARIELQSSNVSVPLDINVSELMTEMLPDSPTWYNIGSSVTHSLYWGLRDVNSSRPGEPLELTPKVLDIGAAAEAAISGSRLILDRSARCWGHDASAHVQRSKERREAVDALMIRAIKSKWARVPTEPPQGGPSGR